jgi:lipoprotein NlpI
MTKKTKKIELTQEQVVELKGLAINYLDNNVHPNYQDLVDNNLIEGYQAILSAIKEERAKPVIQKEYNRISACTHGLKIHLLENDSISFPVLFNTVKDLYSKENPKSVGNAERETNFYLPKELSKEERSGLIKWDKTNKVISLIEVDGKFPLREYLKATNF